MDAANQKNVQILLSAPRAVVCLPNNSHRQLLPADMCRLRRLMWEIGEFPYMRQAL
jgi:hypothetical protein